MLAQLDAPLTLTDGGLETTLIFHDGLDLPHFAAFSLIGTPEGRRALDRYTQSYVDIANHHDVPLIVETATWRASQDWADLLGIDAGSLADLNRRSVALIAAHRADSDTELVVSGCVGPRGDGYVAGDEMSSEAAAEYHRPQIAALVDGGADLVTGITMTNVPEAVGIARAAAALDVPVVISFTVETDGRLPTGDLLSDAIANVDRETDAAPEYYMINCAHPTHFDGVLGDGDWMARLKGIRANASTMSHAELDEAEELDAGDAADLARRYASLRDRFGSLTVFGGCCGTDDTHIAAAAAALTR